MAEHRPLLIFPTYSRVKRDPRHGGGKMPHSPGKAAQLTKLGPKFETLQKAFEAERLAFQNDPQGLEPEFVLVIETRGRIEDFYAAAQNIGMDWLGEIDLEDLQPDEDFYQLNKEGQPSNKTLDGRLYLTMTNQQAMDELLRLWKLYSEDKNLGHGNTKWRDLFDYAADIRRWGAKDRLLDSGILDEWENCIADDAQASTTFRLEIWHKEDDEAGYAEEQAIRKLVESSGGSITASKRINEIRFHGLKGRIPIALAKSALRVRDSEDESSLPALFLRQGIKHFQPIAQGVVTLPQETEAFDFAISPPNDKPPVLALLDGYPFANHNVLDGLLEIHDPDDLLNHYDPREMRHGTAMASLIINGELDAGETQLTRKIYCRPILEPDVENRAWKGGVAEQEHIPEDVFAEDPVHRAIVEMFRGESPTAPTICIVNLSVGEQPFDREMSPWARLIDWLAWEYKLLFCVSVGNQIDSFQLGIKESDFLAKPDKEKINAALLHINETQRKRTLLSPGEAVNTLTVGALHTDSSAITYMANRIDLMPSPNLPSPISRIGPGFRRSIKPEILMPGGRQFFSYIPGGGYGLAKSFLAPGQRVAAPDSTNTGLTNHTQHTRGTSNATALTSRAAARLYEVLDELKKGSGGESISRDTTAPLLKALLVHGASWPDEAVEAINSAVSSQNKRRTLAKYLGYGIANTAKVESCTAQRATVLGCGLLMQDEAHEYRLPLPVELSGIKVWRRLIITLAWLSPVNPKSRVYRKVKLSFSPPTTMPLPVERQQADWQQVQKGTVQHEILEGEKITAFQDGDSLLIKVSAQGDTQQKFDEAIPYGLAVTLEVEEQTGIPIYERVQEKLKLGVKVKTM